MKNILQKKYRKIPKISKLGLEKYFQLVYDKNMKRNIKPLKKNSKGVYKKANSPKHNCYRAPRTNEPARKREKGIIYVALDTSVIIDIQNLFNNQIPKNKIFKYHSRLREMCKQSVLNADGSINPYGRFLFVILPTVKKELSDANGTLHSSIKEFVLKRTMCISLNPTYRDSFEKKVKKISASLKRLDAYKDVEVEKDLDIISESLLFNLTLISRDNHIKPNLSEKNPNRKIEQIKFVSQRQIMQDTDGHPAQPRSVESLFTFISKGGVVSHPNNFCYLNYKLQQDLHDKFNYREPARSSIDLAPSLG